MAGERCQVDASSQCLLSGYRQSAGNRFRHSLLLSVLQDVLASNAVRYPNHVFQKSLNRVGDISV